MARKRVTIYPGFSEQLEFEAVKGAADGEKRKGISKGNTGLFYCHLYTALFGGKIKRCFFDELSVDLSNGDPGNFRPDILRENRHEKTYVEVKSISTDTSRPLCSASQLSLYSYYTLKDIETLKKTVGTEYAVFRYYWTRLREKISTMNNQELAKYLSQHTRNVLVAPLNLMMVLFLSSRRMGMNQLSSLAEIEEKTYFQVYGTTISDMHKEPSETLELIARQSSLSQQELSDLFLFDNIDFERYHVDWIYCGEHRINPFLVTRFFNRNPRVWQETFLKHHRRILENILKIDDLFLEPGELPF